MHVLQTLISSNTKISALLTGTLILSACGGSSNDDNTNPSISDVVPNNSVMHSRSVTIRGLASDNKELKSVGISHNKQLINADLEQDSFSATIEAIAGINAYTVIATDTAGNETTHEASFYYGSQATAGGAHSAIIKDEKIYAWGRNNKGQVGIGAVTKISDDPETATAEHPIIPTLITNQADTKFVSLAFNQNASSALDANGHVWSWGDGDDGQLGLGIANDNVIDETDYSNPQKIKNLTDIVAINRGYDHMLLLKNDGSVLAFGNNKNGQLGDGSSANSDTAVTVQGLSEVVQISAAVSSYAVDKDGRLWAWGNNKYGQLGQGTSDNEVHNTPVEVVFDEAVISVASGKGHALALTQSGKVYAWGLNASSQVGMRPRDTSTIDEPWENFVLTPKLIPGLDDAVAIWANGNQSFVKRADGKIYPWGQNMLGTLGIEEDGNVIEPVSPILELNNVVDLGNGALHTLAIRNDNTLFAWGWSFEGSLGGKDLLNAWTYRLPLTISTEAPLTE